MPVYMISSGTFSQEVIGGPYALSNFRDVELITKKRGAGGKWIPDKSGNPIWVPMGTDANGNPVQSLMLWPYNWNTDAPLTPYNVWDLVDGQTVYLFDGISALEVP